jgi:AraC-like DNA-binding protein
MKANRSLQSHMGFSCEEDMIGKTDFELFPRHLAEKYRQDDCDVISNRTPKLKMVEFFTNEQGLLDWFVTNKFPVFSRHKEVIGVMGVIQAHNCTDKLLNASSQIIKAVEIIQNQFRNNLSIEELAQTCALSPRQLNRYFLQDLGMSPKSFLIRTRIQFTCEALKKNADDSISNISIDHGFYDQASSKNTWG